MDCSMVATVTGVASAVFAGVSSGIAAWTASETRRMVQSDTRPYLVISPHKLDGVHKVHNPIVTIKNYGKGPALLDEVRFFGVTIDLDHEEPEPNFHVSKESVAVQQGGKVLGPSESVDVSFSGVYEMFFGTHKGVRFVAIYNDLHGKTYDTASEWNGYVWHNKQT